MQKELDEKLVKENRIDKKISYYLTEYIYRVLIIQRYILIPLASKTNITPNQVTLFSLMLSLLSFVCIYFDCLGLASFLYILYSFCDHIDGMLARYKKLSSKFGKYLDVFVDNIAFNFVFIIVYISFDVSIYYVVFVIVMMNLHGIVATYYIVPKLKTLKNIQRFGIKKWFFDRGFILGIDASLLGILITIMLFSGSFAFFMLFIGCVFLFDMLYRLHELKINLVIQEIENERK